MNPYQKKRRWKFFLLIFAIVIGGASVAYTDFFVKKMDFDGTIDLHEALNIIANEVGSSPQDFAEFALETLGIKRNVILKLRKRSSTLDSWNKEEIYGKLLNSAGYSVETVEKVKALLAKDTAR